MIKEHKKMYKAGRQWVIGTLFAAGLAVGVGQINTQTVQADADNPVGTEQPAVNTMNNQSSTNAATPSVSKNGGTLQKQAVISQSQPQAAPAAKDAVTQAPAIYNDPTNENHTPNVVNGIQGSVNITGVDASGHKVSTSENGGYAIINADVDQTLSQNGSATNTTNTDQHINILASLPQIEGFNDAGFSVSGQPTVDTSALKDATVQYTAGQGVYLPVDQYLAKFTWAQLMAVQIQGTLPAGAKVTYSVPFTYTKPTAAQLDNRAARTDVNTWIFDAKGAANDLGRLSVRFAKPVAVPP